MKNKLVPEYKFDKFNDVTAEFLLSIGVSGVLLDVDNTLEPYEHPLPGEHVLSWLKELSNAGIRTAIVSNNGRDRIDLFNKDIGMPAYAKAGKPFKKNPIASHCAQLIIGGGADLKLKSTFLLPPPPILEQIGHADGGKPCGHVPAFGRVAEVTILFKTTLPYY